LIPHVQLRLHGIRRAVLGKRPFRIAIPSLSPHAAEAIKYAIEKLPPRVFSGTSLEVNRERYNAEQIRALYESQRYPLTRYDSSL